MSDYHPDLFSIDLTFTQEINPEVDVLFLALGHGHSAQFLTNHSFSKQTKIIDLSNDFRLQKDAQFLNKSFVYGLVEWNKNDIKSAHAIANPGCFATAIQLGILPLAQHQAIKDEVHIHAITGSTGAGQGFSTTSHFSWRNNNISIYKALTHQHLGEISESVLKQQPNMNYALNFIPVRGDFTRGIFASIYTNTDLTENDLVSIYKEKYKNEPFTFVLDHDIHLKQVVNTNQAVIHVRKINGKALVTVAIDNLQKGAAGQAIQNMNLMFGLDETSGLFFKANNF